MTIHVEQEKEIVEATPVKKISEFQLKEMIYINSTIYLFCFFALFVLSKVPDGTNPLDIGASTFPRWVIYIMLIANTVSVLLVFIRRGLDSYELQKYSIAKLLYLISVTIVYIWSINFIDYKISTFLVVIVYLLSQGMKDWKKLILFSGLLVISIYLLFEFFLRVPMP